MSIYIYIRSFVLLSETSGTTVAADNKQLMTVQGGQLQPLPPGLVGDSKGKPDIRLVNEGFSALEMRDDTPQHKVGPILTPLRTICHNRLLK